MPDGLSNIARVASRTRAKRGKLRCYEEVCQFEASVMVRQFSTFWLCKQFYKELLVVKAMFQIFLMVYRDIEERIFSDLTHPSPCRVEYY